jgi:probable HAF family extracellular repeat protein
VVWTNGTITDLGTLGDSGLNGFAYAINNLGQVAGVSMITNSTEGPFLYSGGKMTDLGSNFTAAAINDNTVIVGRRSGATECCTSTTRSRPAPGSPSTRPPRSTTTARSSPRPATGQSSCSPQLITTRAWPARSARRPVWYLSRPRGATGAPAVPVNVL